MFVLLTLCVLQAILDHHNFPQDCHKAPVHSLLLVGQYLFSGDRSGTLKVCLAGADLHTGCDQTTCTCAGHRVTAL